MDIATPDASPHGRGTTTRNTRSTASGGAGLFTLLWLVFLFFLVVEPARLDAVWAWFRDLPVIAQIAGWVLLLPLVIGLAIWQAPWATWIRVTLIVVLAIVNIATFRTGSSGTCG